MGCGASTSEAKYKETKAAEGETSDTTVDDTVAKHGSARGSERGSVKHVQICEATAAEETEGPAVVIDADECKRLSKLESEELGEAVKKSRKRSVTLLELQVMDMIPLIYNVSDSGQLREELQEEHQSIIINKCAEDADKIPDIIAEWMHDAVDLQRREELINTMKGYLENCPETPEKEKRHLKSLSFSDNVDIRALMKGDYSAYDDGNSSNESDGGSAADAEMEQKRDIYLKETRASRFAVCAESTRNHDDDWVPPVYVKTDEQKARLHDSLIKSFMFGMLSEDQLSTVIDAFQESIFKAGDTVITQGDSVGSDEKALYVLETGMLDVYLTGKEGSVKTYSEQGSYFGDLALLYNAPRAATVLATTECLCWALDRDTFNTLVKDGVMKNTERRIEFLKSVEVFKSLTPEEIYVIKDSLREMNLPAGTHIIREGEEGDDFFIIEEGTAVALKGGLEVATYEPGSYCGELALLNNEPRAADVVTRTACTVLTLDRAAFHRLLGPLQTIMEDRAQTAYN